MLPDTADTEAPGVRFMRAAAKIDRVRRCRLRDSAGMPLVLPLLSATHRYCH